jgi:MFS family permease
MPIAVIPTALAAQIAVSVLQQGLPSISVELQTDLHTGLAGLGLMLGTVFAATATSVFAWGTWSDRVGDRRVLLTGLPVTAVALAGTGLAVGAESTAAVVTGLLIAGLGAAAGTAALARALADRVSPGRLGAVLGLRQAAVPAGGLLAALLLPAVAGLFGAGAALATVGAMCAAATIGVAVGLPAVPRHGPRRIPDRRRKAATGATPLIGLPAFLAGNTCYCVAQTGTVALSVTAWHTALGRGATSAAVLFALVQAGTAVVRVVIGRIGDLRPAWEPAALLATGICAAVLLAVLAGAHAQRLADPVQAGLLLAACLPAACWNGLAFTHTTRLAIATGIRDRLGRIHGLQNTAIFAAGGLTPIFVTTIVAQAGWAAAWGVLGCIAAVGVVMHAVSFNKARAVLVRNPLPWPTSTS